MDTPCRIDVDWMSILRQYYEKKIDKFPRKFDVNLNFDARKIDVVAMYFLQRIFDEQKIDVVLTYFVWLTFNAQNAGIVSMYF